MDFLQKLDYMMEKYCLNKNTLSQRSGIPYTTIDGWYKKGYEGMKLSTLRVLSDYFNTVLDYWVSENVTDPNQWKADGFIVNTEEMERVQKYRLLDEHGREIVDTNLEIEYRRCTAKSGLEMGEDLEIEAELEKIRRQLVLEKEAAARSSASTDSDAATEKLA